MKDFLAVFITLLFLVIWLLPAFMTYHTKVNEWAILYLPIVVLTVAWGDVINKHYFKKW